MYLNTNDSDLEIVHTFIAMECNQVKTLYIIQCQIQVLVKET